MTPAADPPDYDTDNFEDARDDSLPETRTRSLTDRTSVGSLTTPKATKPPPLPVPSLDQEKQNDDTSHNGDNADPEPDTIQSPEKRPKSPLLTTHRLSTSSLDDVNLAGPRDGEDGDGDLEPEVPTKFPSISSNQASSSTSPPAAPSRSSKQGSIFQSFSPSLPSVPWGAAAANNNSNSNNSPNKSLPPQPPAPSSKKLPGLPGPFSWLSRGNSAQKDVRNSASSSTRRNTGASVSTLSSNPEYLTSLQEGIDGDAGSTDSKRQTRNSLKDQFKLLRLREEGGGVAADDGSSITSTQDGTRSGAAVSPPNTSYDKLDVDQPPSSTLHSPVATSPLATTVNPNLAPGTVSGISASASDVTAPVNWELWEDIVNHGPEALKGTNAEELRVAIKRGIPQTIRGVIWQVLAGSRNPELEEVYRELSSRNPEKERDRYWSGNVQVNGHTNGIPKEKESIKSSRSSVRSGRSTPTTSSMYGVASPASTTADAETVAKAEAALEAVRRKKAKEDAAALQKLEKAIRRDLGSRTSYSKYFMSQRNQDGLFGVCKAYALYDEAVGYAQGMNFIVMPLLFNMDDAEAFTLLVKLMNQYGLRNLFIQDMPGLHLHLFQFERLLEELEPALYCHLRRRGVNPQLYATQWFLTLFAYRFPLQLVLRIYDLILEDGLESTILRFAVAIMRRNAQTLLTMNDMTALTNFLKEKLFDVYIDSKPSASSILESGFFGSSGPSDKEIYRADIMVEDACSIKLSSESIKTYTAEWEEKTRVEKEQLAELESYKQSVFAQASRIRTLEEQAEKSDKEHVQLASELVRIKVENEELKDTNESLKGQVEELKKVVDRQPVEVEDRLRTEMDRIMKRNIEVQNLNRSMEEQMADMEKELVATKMKWAELSENHEALKQKWCELRKAFDH